MSDRAPADKGEVALFVGPSAIGTWGPWTLDEAGVGGSEEAVVHMASQLARLGWKVVVYAEPGDRAGVYDGVEWRSYSVFPADFDVLVLWRRPEYVDFLAQTGIPARKKYLWVHDLLDAAEFTEARLARLTKVIFVSEVQASWYAETIPESKVLVSGNGVDPAAFEAYDGQIVRDPHRCLYTSSYDRGLDILYGVWPEVRSAVPDATLHVFYGWQVFDLAAEREPAMRAYKESILELQQSLEGVSEYGRVGHAEIIREIFSAGVLAYPCTFPEVYCVSLVKALAGGAYPVTSDYTTLGVFNRWGTRVPYRLGDIAEFVPRFRDALIAALLQPQVPFRREMMQSTRRRFAWSRTVDGWDREFSS